MWVYNVHRNPRGAFTPILNLFLELPPRVFLGILSEYWAQKYSPELVNKDFGDFLVMLYICIYKPPLSPAYPLAITRVFFTKHQGNPKNIVRDYPRINQGFFWLTLVENLGGVNFCNLVQPCEPLNLFLV